TTAYEVATWLDFRRVLFRSVRAGVPRGRGGRWEAARAGGGRGREERRGDPVLPVDQRAIAIEGDHVVESTHAGSHILLIGGEMEIGRASCRERVDVGGWLG